MKYGNFILNGVSCAWQHTVTVESCFPCACFCFRNVEHASHLHTTETPTLRNPDNETIRSPCRRENSTNLNHNYAHIQNLWFKLCHLLCQCLRFSLSWGHTTWLYLMLTVELLVLTSTWVRNGNHSHLCNKANKRVQRETSITISINLFNTAVCRRRRKLQIVYISGYLVSKQWLWAQVSPAHQNRWTSHRKL